MSSRDEKYAGTSILYVEDDQATRNLLSEIITRQYPDVRLLVAENGNEGLLAFKQFHPEIVLTDINMPELNGIGMAREIKFLNPKTEILALTAFTTTQHMLQAIEIGISHYILKPVVIEKFFNAIDKALAVISSEREIARQNELIRELNKELALKSGSLELANKELEAFTYTVAHDLRLPMVIISDFCKSVLDSHCPDKNDVVGNSIQSIHQEISRINNLVETLLKFSLHSNKHVDKKWTDLSKIAHEVKDNLLAQEHRSSVTFRIGEEINGFGDPVLLRIVLENLLGNAWKYSARQDSALIEFGTISREDDLVYYVRDNGQGFDQQNAERLFLPFHRDAANDETEGFGIGLATVRRIISRHGGKIWAEGVAGEGATFYFVL